MPATQICQPDLNFVDSRRAVNDQGGNDTSLTNYADTASIATLKASLSSYDSNTYTTAMLDTMNVNDLVFAWRQTSSSSNAKSIADYVPRQAVRS